MQNEPKDFVSIILNHFANGGEVRNPAEGLRLTDPATPNSGFTVGTVQRDLASAPKDLQKIMGVLRQDSTLAAQAAKLADILGKKASQLTQPETDLINDHKDAINNQLGKLAGRAVLKEIDTAQAKKLEQKVNELAANAGPNAKDFMNSTEGKLRITDYLNQFGTKTDKLEPFLRGEEVTLISGKTRIKLDGSMTVEKWKEYVKGTKHGSESPGDVDRRFKEVDGALGRNGIKPDAPRKPPAKPDQDSAAPKDGDPAPGNKDGAGDGAAAGSPASETRRAEELRDGEGKGGKKDKLYRPGEDKGGVADKLLRPGGERGGERTEEQRPEFRRFATEVPTGADAIMLKNPLSMTEGEMVSLIHQPGYDRDQAQNRRVRLWHEANFGTNPVPRDATGRQIDAGPMRTIPKTETPPRDADGGGLTKGMEAISGLVTRAAGNVGLPGGVKALQSAVNDITEGDERFPAMPLKTDGIFGPATRDRLRNVVVRQGSDAVANAFNRFLV